MRHLGGTKLVGEGGTSPDKRKGVKSDVSLKQCPTSKLDQRVRWTCREEDAKEAKPGW